MTIQNALRNIAVVTIVAATATATNAQGNYFETDGPRHRVGIGTWAFASSNDTVDNAIDALDLRSAGTTLSYSYSFFRPRRHEATVNFQGFLRSERHGLGAVGEAAVREGLARTMRRDTAILSSEYRWRFGGYGQAWYGLGLGIANSGRDTIGVGVSSLGYDVSNQWFVEFRSYSDDKEGMLGSFTIGAKF
jgi:hypothetical protein